VRLARSPWAVSPPRSRGLGLPRGPPCDGCASGGGRPEAMPLFTDDEVLQTPEPRRAAGRSWARLAVVVLGVWGVSTACATRRRRPSHADAERASVRRGPPRRWPTGRSRSPPTAERAGHPGTGRCWERRRARWRTDAGPHRLRVECPGFEPWEQTRMCCGHDHSLTDASRASPALEHREPTCRGVRLPGSEVQEGRDRVSRGDAFARISSVSAEGTHARRSADVASGAGRSVSLQGSNNSTSSSTWCTDTDLAAAPDGWCDSAGCALRDENAKDRFDVRSRRWSVRGRLRRQDPQAGGCAAVAPQLHAARTGTPTRCWSSSRNSRRPASG